MAAERFVLDHQRQELAFLIDRDATVENQMIIAHQPHRAAAFQEENVLP